MTDDRSMYAKTDCDAVERAKKLINSEGMLLVEHILLRPRCEEDCNCLIQTCDVNPINCKWKWKPSGYDDPCDEKNVDLTFEPPAKRSMTKHK